MSRYKNTNKQSAITKQSAIALKYNPAEDYAPVIVASGHGTTAEKIIEIADTNGVPVYRDDSAASLLTMLDVGKSIPPELYEVVAAIYIEVVNKAKEIKDANSGL